MEHHVLDGQNQIKEVDRLDAIKERLPHVYAEMEQGNNTLICRGHSYNLTVR